jgi:putative NADPH-quinone reductase/putative sterol carrier protein
MTKINNTTGDFLQTVKDWENRWINSSGLGYYPEGFLKNSCQFAGAKMDLPLDEGQLNDEIADYFRYIARYYSERTRQSLIATFQFAFTNRGQSFVWHLMVDREKISFEKGPAEAPDLIIDIPYTLWLEISSGKKNATREYLKKSYRIKGPLKKLLEFQNTFGSIIRDARKKTGKQIDPWENSRNPKWHPPENIVVINASPRLDKGFTYRYLKPFLQGLSSAGAKTETIHLYDRKFVVEPCRGCESCWKTKQGKCIINDDGDSLLQTILKARLTVFAFPLYIDSVPAKLKALLDRFFVRTLPEFNEGPDGLTRHPVTDQRERYFAILSVCGFPETRHFKPVVDTFRDIGRNFHAPVLANILRPGSQFLYLNPLMAAERFIVEKSLTTAGEELAAAGKIKKRTLNRITHTGKISVREWCYYSNFYWGNPNRESI